MGTVLFTWELGAGIGHLMLISPIAKALAAAGHRVLLAAKDVSAAHRVLGEFDIEILSTPGRFFALPFPQQQTYAHLLANVGFGSDTDLAAQTAAWKTLYRLIKPDVIVFNHSPVALLAAKGLQTRRALIGSGFFVPPDTYPLPAFLPGPDLDWKRINEVEDAMLKRTNALLHSWNQPPLEYLAQLYAQVDEFFLTTYPQLDHFPNRGAKKYWGTINDGEMGGKDPIWPKTSRERGKKIFAYLRMFPALPQLLQALSTSSQPTLIFAPDIDENMRKHFSSPMLRFEDQRLHMGKVVTECDMGVIYGGATTVATLLRAAKPLLVVPMVEEQGIMARLIHASGAGLGVLPDQPAEFSPRLELVLSQKRFNDGASRLADQLCQIDLAESKKEIIRRLQALLA